MKRKELPIPEKSRSRAPLWIFLILCVASAGTFVGIMAGNGISPREMWRRVRGGGVTVLSLEPLSRRTHMTRPYGMAPVAYQALMRACNNAHIQPDRIGQTIGDNPLSVGYHKRDGVLDIDGRRIDYCAAVDLGAVELTEPQRQKFLHELTKQGFAAWYRSGGKWTGGEHIHAVYALLPMKPQLQQQVREFMQARRDKDIRPLRWERIARRHLD